MFLFSPEGIVNAAAPTPGVENVQDEVDPMAPTKPNPDDGTKPDEKTNPVEKPDFEKAGVPSIAEADIALSRLNVLPNPAGDAVEGDINPEDFVESPWTAVPQLVIDPAVWQKAELKLVDVATLQGTDTVLSREKVANRIKTMGQSLKPYRNFPLVYDDGEKQTIIDGHHRLLAMWLLGMDQVPVWLGTPDMAKESSLEVKAFMKWASKGKRARQFEFKALDPIVGDALNRCYFDGDTDTMKSLAKAYLT